MRAARAAGTARSAPQIRRALRDLGSPRRAAARRRFFKTGPGQYGEGDTFVGVTVPQIRRLVRRFHPASLEAVVALLRSSVHEERLLGLLLLVERCRRGTPEDRRTALRLYLTNVKHVNNWDLVDASAEHIVGAQKVARTRLLLWARSENLWLRRIAVVWTFYSIRRNRFADTLALARGLLGDPEDLIHKSVGWMLREVGKRDARILESFLRRHHHRMPRTMLRYAIERFPGAIRKGFLSGRLPGSGRNP